MRRMNNLLTLFTAIAAFFFGSFITKILVSVDRCPTQKSGIVKMDPHPDIFLIILIFTAPSNLSRRQAMRVTWLKLGQPLQRPYYPEDYIYLPDYNKRGFLELESVSEQVYRQSIYTDWLDSLPKIELNVKRNIKVKHFFAIGTHSLDPGLRAELVREQSQYKDLLLLPRLYDSYANLTHKLLHSMDALTNHYNFSYMLKSDDDTYVKLDFLLNELVSYDRKLLRKATEYREQPLPQLYWGYFDGRAIMKTTKSKWAEDMYYISRGYITYALGGGYVISRKLCEYVAQSIHVLSPYVSEDVSMGTWLAPLRHVYRRHDIRFDTTYTPRKCRRQHLVLHKRNEKLMHDLYSGKLCTFEKPNEAHLWRPPAYYYDWHKTADKCCESWVEL